MIPSLLASEIKNSIAEFLATEVSLATPSLANSLQVDTSFFLGLPLRQGTIRDLSLGFTHYLHQELAFKRLQAPNYQSTLIVTKTPSSQTEYYLMPILDHCYQHKHKKGIKAILVYPFDSLAINQSKYLASLLQGNPKLNNNLSAGLLLNTSREEKHQSTDINILRQNPPDILLTSPKMLNYLLLSPLNQQIWARNTSSTLRYLVIEALHTFDQTQSSDLAGLIRRLKARLNTPRNHLVCVGTLVSLTVKDNQQELLTYAKTLFDETFLASGIIRENRLSSSEFLVDATINPQPIPTDCELLNPKNYQNLTKYLETQYQLWFNLPLNSNWNSELANHLQSLPIIHNIFKIFDSQPIISQQDLQTKLAETNSFPSHNNPEYPTLVLDSLFSLLAIAINPEGNPWVEFQVQFSLTSLTKMVKRVTSLASMVIATIYNSPYHNHSPELTVFADLAEDVLTTSLYQITIRIALAQFLVTTSQGISVQIISQQLPNYWRAKLGNDLDYVSTFLPPDLESLSGKLSPQLLQLLNQRLESEAIAELGLRSRDHGSLETTATCSISLEKLFFTPACQELLGILTSQISGLERLQLEDVERFILGLVYHLRQKVGIFANITPEKPVNLLTTSWYQNWLDKIFSPYSPLIVNQLENLSAIILDNLVRKGILKVDKANQIRGIAAEALLLNNQTYSLNCNQCGHQIICDPSELLLWTKMPCLCYQCQGNYRQPSESKTNFLRNFYRESKLQGIYVQDTPLSEGKIRDADSLTITITNNTQQIYKPVKIIKQGVDSLYLDLDITLKQQLIAYSLDCWVISGISVDELPEKLGVVLNNIQKLPPKSFPYNWLEFCHNNQQRILANFAKIFSEQIKPITQQQLQDFMATTQAGGMSHLILNRLQKLATNREQIKKQLQTLTLANKHEEIELLKKINKKSILDFLTEEELFTEYVLPNTQENLLSTTLENSQDKSSPVIPQSSSFVSPYLEEIITVETNLEAQTELPWTELEEILFDEHSLTLLAHMRQYKWLFPNVGYELTNQKGTVIGEAEFAWVEQKTALLLDDTYSQTFQNYGWNVSTVAATLEQPEVFRQKYLRYQ
ncbi:MAG: DEAD/DEAH box helicase [Gloeocapsa sp. DLM2.Bin57]|nr:MAG: DEAD/DEAH box helicase [Gloeocapsa sp. DLM2.Bin57]